MYRNLLLLGILLSLSFHLSAQVGKGFFAGGSINTTFYTTFGNYSGNSGLGFNLGIAPRVGYYFSDRWSVGISGSTGFNNFNSYRKGYVWSSGIFSRYALPIGLDGKLMLWGELDAKWTSAEYWDKTISGRSNILSAGYASTSLSAGLLFFPTTKWGIEVGIGSLMRYERKILENGSQIYGGHFSFLNLGNSSPQLGIHYYFNR
jgi:hypothetical protein